VATRSIPAKGCQGRHPASTAGICPRRTHIPLQRPDDAVQLTPRVNLPMNGERFMNDLAALPDQHRNPGDTSSLTHVMVLRSADDGCHRADALPIALQPWGCPAPKAPRRQLL
jgi:hypothetical protein